MSLLHSEPFAMNVTHSQINDIVEILLKAGFKNNLLNEKLMRRSNFKATGSYSYTEQSSKIKFIAQSDNQGNLKSIVISYFNMDEYGSVNNYKIKQANLELALFFI
jgi:hypothetical protein